MRLAIICGTARENSYTEKICTLINSIHPDSFIDRLNGYTDIHQSRYPRLDSNFDAIIWVMPNYYGSIASKTANFFESLNRDGANHIFSKPILMVNVVSNQLTDSGAIHFRNYLIRIADYYGIKDKIVNKFIIISKEQMQENPDVFVRRIKEGIDSLQEFR